MQAGTRFTAITRWRSASDERTLAAARSWSTGAKYPSNRGGGRSIRIQVKDYWCWRWVGEKRRGWDVFCLYYQVLVRDEVKPACQRARSTSEGGGLSGGPTWTFLLLAWHLMILSWATALFIIMALWRWVVALVALLGGFTVDKTRCRTPENPPRTKVNVHIP